MSKNKNKREGERTEGRKHGGDKQTAEGGVLVWFGLVFRILWLQSHRENSWLGCDPVEIRLGARQMWHEWPSWWVHPERKAHAGEQPVEGATNMSWAPLQRKLCDAQDQSSEAGLEKRFPWAPEALINVWSCSALMIQSPPQCVLAVLTLALLLRALDFLSYSPCQGPRLKYFMYCPFLLAPLSGTISGRDQNSPVSGSPWCFLCLSALFSHRVKGFWYSSLLLTFKATLYITQLPNMHETHQVRITL